MHDERFAARRFDERHGLLRPSSSMSMTAMRAPCSANSTAAARPCPDAAPVMHATLPARDCESTRGPYATRAEHATYDQLRADAAQATDGARGSDGRGR